MTNYDILNHLFTLDVLKHVEFGGKIDFPDVGLGWTWPQYLTALWRCYD
jgi:hypothetical protein